MESDSEGSLRDFIDDDNDDDDETTKSSGGSSSDESDVQVMTREAGSKSKSTNKITRMTRSKGNVEGEWSLCILTTSLSYAWRIYCVFISSVYPGNALPVRLGHV